MRELVAAAAGDDAAALVEFGLTEKQDWVANALAGLAPVRAGRFLVHGAHDRDKVGPSDIGVEIEAGLAFGTGHHGTTRGCLLHFDRLLKRRRPRKVLDVGCGAGVLAIAAAKVLRRKVWLGDIDPVAVEVANENARLNGVGAYAKAIVSRGVENRALREGGPFDLVFANILAKPLRLLAPSLAARDSRGRRGDRLRPALRGCARACCRPGARRGFTSRADRSRGLGEPAVGEVGALFGRPFRDFQPALSAPPGNGQTNIPRSRSTAATMCSCAARMRPRPRVSSWVTIQ